MTCDFAWHSHLAILRMRFRRRKARAIRFVALTLLGAATATSAALETRRASEMLVGVGIVEACAGCHGENGFSVGERVPNLAGQKSDYLHAQLTAFKSRVRKHELMNAVAAQLGEQEIIALAEHFSSLPIVGTKVLHRKSPLLAIFTKSSISIPENYSSVFTRYHVADDLNAKTIASYYANDVAINAARSGLPLPDGSMIVAQHSKAKLASDGNPLFDESGRLTPDRVTSLVAMARERAAGATIPILLRNGDWRYAAFTPDRNERSGLNYAECFACHLPLARSNYIFTNTELYARHPGKRE
jgi:cytochrome c553